jgi:glycosyltransferase involved in cell wall biosynthesis
MKILLVGDYPDDPRLGSAKVYHKLREELRALGHQCDVLLGPEIGARPRSVRMRWLLAPTLAERAVHRAFRRNGGYDVVDAASGEGFVVGVRRRLRAYRRVALVSRSHGLEQLNYRRMLDDHEWGIAAKPWLRRFFYPAARLSQVALAARLADRLLVLNESDRAYAVGQGWKRAGDVVLVPHGVSRRFLDEAPPPEAPRGRGLLFCGSWDRMKGIDYLAAAMGILARDGTRWPLTVLGPGAPADAVLAAFPPEARPLVTVVPRADEDEVMRHYREHDLLLQTSTYEGFGMVVVEAMSQRLPVVATAVGAAPALLAGGRGGILIPPRQPEAVAAAVRRLMEDAPLRRRMADDAHAAVRGMSWTATAEKTLEVYEGAVADARGRGAKG